MKTRLSRKFFCLLLTVVMACTLLPITALADGPSGSINGAVITQNAVSVELENVNFKSSVEVQLYSGDKLLTTATLNTEKDVTAGTHNYLTCCIGTKEADEYWPLTPWTPRDDVVPNRAVLFVDGNKMGEKTFTLNAKDWANLPGTVLPPSGTILRAYLNKDRITVDMADVTFYKSVALELYSGDTLLTTSTLNAKLLPPADRHDELTGMIGLTATDEYWTYTAWTPKKDVVPDTVKLLVDGVVKDDAKLVVVFNGEETKPMPAEDWAALPGTYSGSIERAGITHDNGVLKNAVSVDLKDVNFESSVQVQLYSGETLLTTATLNTDKLGAGSHPYLTCCIATETADEYWALTPWTPKDDVVPNKAVLVVDGHELDEETFKLNADEWAALPGTAFPYTVTYLDGFSGTYATYTNLKYGDATPEPANPYRSGYIFLGWEPSVAPTVTGNAEYVAQWRYIGPQYPNPTPVQPTQPTQPGILPPQTGDMPLWYAIVHFLGLA